MVFLIPCSSFCCYENAKCFVTVCCENVQTERETERGGQIKRERKRERGEGRERGCDKAGCNISLKCVLKKSRVEDSAAAATTAVTTAVNLWTSVTEKKPFVAFLGFCSFVSWLQKNVYEERIAQNKRWISESKNSAAFSINVTIIFLHTSKNRRTLKVTPRTVTAATVVVTKTTIPGVALS